MKQTLLWLSLACSLTAARGLELPYELPRDAELSAGVFTADGQLVRWLEQSVYRYQGKNVARWDGLDQFGEPAAPGDYKLRVAYHGPLSVSYLGTANNPGTPPWPTEDDRGDWLSDEMNPQAAATDGQWVFLAAPGCEDGFGVIAVDERGRRVWGLQLHHYPRAVSLSVDGDLLYLVCSGAVVTDKTRVYKKDNVIGQTTALCLDKRTGRPAGLSKGQGQPEIKLAEWPYHTDYTFLWELRANKSFTPAKNGGQPRYSATDVTESTNSFGSAALNGRLYVSMMYDNEVVEYDAATGQPTGVKFPVPAPAGLCAFDRDKLLSVSGRQVVVIDPREKSVAPFIRSGLSAPACVTTDRAGKVYVSDWGDSFQVKQFTGSGRFIKAIGKAGGRPWRGPWEPDGMLVPRGLAVTDSGKLWVAEDDNLPKRVSVWDTASGKFEQEYIGPASYGGGGFFWLDPKDPTLAVSNATRFKIDYATKTGKPLAVTYRRQELSDAFIPHGAEVQGPAKVLYHNGAEYVCIVHNRGVFGILKREGDVYNAVAGFTFRRREHDPHLRGDGAQVVAWDSDIGYHLYDNYYPDFFNGHLGDYGAWADLNGDRRAQADEMRWLKASATFKDGGIPAYDTAWWGSIGDDFSLYFVTGFSADGRGIYKLTPEWRGDVPVYDASQAALLFTVPKSEPIIGIYPAKDGKLIATYATEFGKGAVSFAAFDQTGMRLWGIAMPEKWEWHSVHGSGLVYDYQLPGLGDVCLTWNWHGNTRSYLFTTSGDYIGTPLADGHHGPLASWGESFRGGYQDAAGQPYILNGANQALHVLKLGGLEQEQSGIIETNYQLSASGVREAAAGRALPVSKVAEQPLLRVIWPPGPPPVIDGNLDDWNLDEGVRLERGPRQAAVALRRDADNLYLAYRVWEPAPLLRNGGADWQRLFIAGDCVDLMLQTDTANPHRRELAAGDARLLLTEFEGKPLAVLYRPVVPGAKDSLQFMAARIDEVKKLASAKVAIQRDQAGGCYTVEAAVPLKDLGVEPRRSEALRGDVGVIFADESGRNRALRLYYYNHDTDMVQDLTTEATLQPHEWGALLMPLGENLLSNSGFESPLADDDQRGWAAVNPANFNGGTATVSGELSRSGRHALLLSVERPVAYPDDMFQNADYNAFRKSANDGKGPSSAAVRQRVSVSAGEKYAARFCYHGTGLQPEQKNPGRPRGYIFARARLDWVCAAPFKGSGIGLLGEGNDHDDWQTANNNNTWFISKPLEAPEGATAAILSFDLIDAAEQKIPKVYIDNVELVRVKE